MTAKIVGEHCTASINKCWMNEDILVVSDASGREETEMNFFLKFEISANEIQNQEA